MKNNFYISIYTLIFTFLLISLIFYLFKNNIFKTESCLEIMMYNRKFEKELGITLEESLSKKRIINYNLTGNEVIDKKLINKFQLDLRKLIKSKDQLKCLHVKFDDKIKYEVFVKTLEICIIEKAEIYIPFENNLWVTNHKKK